MWWLILLAIIAMFICIGLPMIIEYKAEDKVIKQSKEKHKKYLEILDLEEDGICKSCDYGVNNCYIEGRAYCKTLKEVNKDE